MTPEAMGRQVADTIRDRGDAFELRGDPGVCTAILDADRHIAEMEVAGGVRIPVPWGVGRPVVGRQYLVESTPRGDRWIKVFVAGIKAAWWVLRNRTSSLGYPGGGTLPFSHWEASVGDSRMVAETDQIGGATVFTTLTQDGADITGSYVGPPADSGPSFLLESFAHLCPSATPGIYYLVSLRYSTDRLAACKLYRNSGAAPATFVYLADIPLPDLGRLTIAFRTIAADPVAPDTVYVGSTDVDAGGTVYAPALIKTTNAGATWTRLTDPFTDASGTYSIGVIGTLGGGNLLVEWYGTDIAGNGWGYSTSKDDGATWVHVGPGGPAAPDLSPVLFWTRGDYKDPSPSDELFPVPMGATFESVLFTGDVALDHFYDFYYAPVGTVDNPTPPPVAMIGPNYTNQQEVTGSGVLTPPLLTVNTNDYNPTGLAGASRLDIRASSAIILSGIQAQPDGTRLTILNAGSSNIDLQSQNVASAAPNRFYDTSPSGTILHAGEFRNYVYQASYDPGGGPVGAWVRYLSARVYGYIGGLWYLDPDAGLAVI